MTSSSRLSFLVGEPHHQVEVNQIYCRRQMLMLSQGEHATTCQHTETESHLRWFAWDVWQGEWILARYKYILQEPWKMLMLTELNFHRVTREALQWLKMETIGRSQVWHHGDRDVQAEMLQEFMLMPLVSYETKKILSISFPCKKIIFQLWEAGLHLPQDQASVQELKSNLSISILVLAVIYVKYLSSILHANNV